MNDFADVATRERVEQEQFRADAINEREEIDRLIRALNREGDHRRVFQFGGRAAVVTVDNSQFLRTIKGTSTVTRSVPRVANDGLLKGPIEMVSTWWKWFRTGDGEDRQVKIPPWVTKMIVDIHGEGLKPLAGIADFPVISTTGKLLTGKLGYEPITRLYVDNRPVDYENHSFASVTEAYDFLIGDWLGEFCFATPQDAARALALPLTVLNRRTRISAGAPIPFVTAPTPNTGKTLLVQVLVEAVTGQQLPATSWDHDNEAERRKMFMAVGLENPPAVLFDNINNGWGVKDPTLERWCTSDSISDRLLSKNENASVPTTSLLVYTGNNIVAGTPDLESRSYVVRMEKPAKRAKFKRADIMGWTSANRAKIFAALMMIAKAKVPATYVPDSRFPTWSKFVGGPIQYASGLKDLFDDWSQTTDFVNEELEEMLFAMANLKDGPNHRGYLPVEFSEFFSEKLAKLDPFGTKQWMWDASGALKTAGKVPPISVPKLLRKYDGHLAGKYRLRLEKGENPQRPERKSWLIKAVAV